ncbi:hypothetical protein UPYG_G00293320 [Umbra pygmaea]|uniref:Uncharacterized protein n=1 Tax=Umbra pygmaea TaxID=75934 RepID=A0ABD0W626_UMBPY
MKIENILVLFALVILTSSSETKGVLNVLPTIVTPFTLQREGMSNSSPVFSLVNENGNSEPDSANHLSPNPEAAVSTTPYVTDCNNLLQKESVTDTGNKDDMAVTNQITTSPTTAKNAFNTISQDNADATPTSYGITPIQSPAHLSTPELTSTQPLATDQPHKTATVHAPAGLPHREFPPELNVGDEDQGPPLPSPLDPLLAGLVSIFIITTAVISIVLFLKMVRRTNHPEFHHLQDLPMDDLMEDTPLSRCTYTY